MIKYVLTAVVMLALVACDQGKEAAKAGKKAEVANKPATGRSATTRSKTQSKKVSTKPVPAKASAKDIPYIDPNLAFKGETLYLQNCVFCHQADAIGKPGVAPSLTNQEFLSIAPVDFLYETIRDGRPGTGMPPFKHLGKEGITAIVAYLRDHAKLPSRIKEVDSQPRSQGDERRGKLIFEQICATCHGPGGNGYAAGGTGTAIGKRGFLDKVSDGFIRVTIKEGRSFTRMLPFQGPNALADLDDQTIDDIIAYLRTAPAEKKQP